MELSPKENLYRALVEHKTPEWVPNGMTDISMVGGQFETFENGPLEGGFDGFGVEWHGTASAGGQPVPVPNQYVLDDILDWEDVVKFPNLDDFDWVGQAGIQLAHTNRDTQMVEYMTWNDVFLRLTHLMGFENALISMATEPEACSAFFSAVADYKIKIAERVKEYFNADMISHFDDVATESGLFMSPTTYREIIKPHHKRLNDAIKDLGMLPIQHCCGKCEDIIPDFIDEGAVAWTSAQPMNDIVAIQKEYGDKISVIGGYDTNGRPGMPGVSIEEIQAEIRRCVDTYAPQGSYVFSGLLLGGDGQDFLELHMPLITYASEYGASFYK